MGTGLGVTVKTSALNTNGEVTEGGTEAEDKDTV